MVLPFGVVKVEAPLFGISPGQWIVVSLGLLAVWAVVVWSSWRCPACGRRPGGHWRPQYCQHCDAPLLYPRSRAGELPHLASREEWQREEAEWYRQGEIAWAARRMVGLIVIVIAVFIFGIILGVGAQPGEKGQGAALGFAGILAVLGWVLARWIRQGFGAAGIPPERVERGMRALLAVVGMVMIFLGLGGLLYIVSPFDPTPVRWELRLEPLARMKAMAAACGSYVLGGLFLVARGVRGERS
jgi:hypothetical protein